MDSTQSLRERIHQVIFESDTKAGKFFDVVLLVLILASVLTVVLESVPAIHSKYYFEFSVAEWFFTIIFSIEYILRLYTLHKPISYVKSFYGIIDLLAIIPTYFSLLIPGTQYLLVIRSLRLLRVFRIFKMKGFIKEAYMLKRALHANSSKIFVFLIFIVITVTILGTVMYLIEGQTNPSMSSIPKGIYWAIVTLTTVGFGDVTPVTSWGQFVSTIVMILGYSVIAVPTGIVTAEIISQKVALNTQSCPGCGYDKHDDDAKHCKRCGTKL